MKMTGKTAGIGLVALSAVMLAGAGIADTMRGDQGMGMMMGPGSMLDIATLDTDKDGKISEAEIEAHRAAQLAAVDADKNGLLSAEELAAMHVKAMTERANAMAQRMIERLDGDGDGLLSAAELASRPMPANLFDRIDASAVLNRHGVETHDVVARLYGGRAAGWEVTMAITSDPSVSMMS